MRWSSKPSPTTTRSSQRNSTQARHSHLAGLGHQFWQFGGDVFRRGSGAPARNYIARAVDEKLLEVPTNISTVAVASVLSLEHRVQRGLLGTVDVDLGEHRKVDVIVLRDKRADFVRTSWFLAAELIAGEAENRQPVNIVVKRTQTCVLRGSPSLTCDVNDETMLASKLLERDSIACQGIHS